MRWGGKKTWIGLNAAVLVVVVAAILVFLFVPLTEERRLPGAGPPLVPAPKPPAPLPTAQQTTKPPGTLDEKPLGTRGVEESDPLRALGYKIEATPRGPNQPKKSVVTGLTRVPIKLKATGIIRIRVKLMTA